MSEETKTPDGDYVMMGGAGPAPGTGQNMLSASLGDPNLSQEDRDHRLAIALQQQENAAAYDAHKKKHDQAVKANSMRTTRSNTHTRLAAVRDKDQGMLSVPAEYTTENAYVKKDSSNYVPPGDSPDESMLAGATPQQIADFKLAKELQKVEQVGAGTVREMDKIVKEEDTEAAAANRRTARGVNQP